MTSQCDTIVSHPSGGGVSRRAFLAAGFSPCRTFLALGSIPSAGLCCLDVVSDSSIFSSLSPAPCLTQHSEAPHPLQGRLIVPNLETPYMHINRQLATSGLRHVEDCCVLANGLRQNVLVLNTLLLLHDVFPHIQHTLHMAFQFGCIYLSRLGGAHLLLHKWGRNW